jgi:hypothetical protein
MKKILVYIGILITMISCSYSGTYKVSLQYVENQNIQNDTIKILSYQDIGITKYSYEDSQIKIIWLPLNTQFNFTLINKSSHTMKIIWDDGVYVNENGNCLKILHNGVQNINKNNSQLSTIIVKGANIDDAVAPIDNVYLQSGQYGGLNVSSLFKNTVMSTDEFYILKNIYVGKIVKILLPIKINDIVNEYIFYFKIDDILYQKKEKIKRTRNFNTTHNR